MMFSSVSLGRGHVVSGRRLVCVMYALTSDRNSFRRERMTSRVIFPIFSGQLVRRVTLHRLVRSSVFLAALGNIAGNHRFLLSLI